MLICLPEILKLWLGLIGIATKVLMSVFGVNLLVLSYEIVEGHMSLRKVHLWFEVFLIHQRNRILRTDVLHKFIHLSVNLLPVPLDVTIA